MHVSIRLKTRVSGAFSVSAPTPWHALLLHIEAAQSLDAFKSLLKTYLFSLPLTVLNLRFIRLDCLFLKFLSQLFTLSLDFYPLFLFESAYFILSSTLVSSPVQSLSQLHSGHRPSPTNSPIVKMLYPMVVFKLL